MEKTIEEKVLDLIKIVYSEEYYRGIPIEYPDSIRPLQTDKFDSLIEFANNDLNVDIINYGNPELDCSDIFEMSLSKNIPVPFRLGSRDEIQSLINKLNKPLYYLSFRWCHFGPYITPLSWTKYTIENGSIRTEYLSEINQNDAQNLQNKLESFLQKNKIEILLKEFLRTPVSELEGHMTYYDNLRPTVFVCLFGEIYHEEFNVKWD